MGNWETVSLGICFSLFVLSLLPRPFCRSWWETCLQRAMICFERRISSFHWCSMWKGWMWRITQPLTRWPSQRNSCASCMSTELPATSPWWVPSRVTPKSQGGHLECFGCHAIGKGVRRGFNPSAGGDGDTLRTLIPPHCTLQDQRKAVKERGPAFVVQA